MKKRGAEEEEEEEEEEEKKMFRLNKSEKYGERLDFLFSNLQALQVPKGWDKLFVSIISPETGKALVKSGKASVRNGVCQWTDSLSKSLWISQHEDPSKGNEQCLVKLLVSLGSSRSGNLGEATVNLASHVNSKFAVPVSLPLKKCSHGTILKVKIQCLTPRAELRGACEDTSSHREYSTVDHEDAENKSDVSDSSFGRSVGSSSSIHLESTSCTGDSNRDMSFSALGRRSSSDSMDGSFGGETFSAHNNLSGIVNIHIRRQDSTGSQREEFNWVSRTAASSPLRNSGSSQDLLEAAEFTIEELRAQATMWEQNSRKLMNDVERLKKELSDQSKHWANLEMELSDSHTECDYLKQEVKRLNVLLEESKMEEPVAENLKLQSEEMGGCQKELEDELKFQKESNADLALQLKKAQESNLELVYILQELEGTIEKQKIEIVNMSSVPSENKDVRKHSPGFENNEETKQNKQVVGETMNSATCLSDLDNVTVTHKLEDLPAFSEVEGRQWQGSLKNSEYTMKCLDRSLEEKIHELAIERSLKNQTLAEVEVEWRDGLETREEESCNGEIKLSEALGALGLENNGNLIKEIGVLKQKIEELEKDCNELTDENLELLLKLKESERPAYHASSNSSSCECGQNGSLSTSESEVSKRKSQQCKHEEELNQKKILVEEISRDHLQMQCIDLGKKCADLELQLQAFKDKTSYLDSDLCKNRAKLQEREKEIAALQQQLKQTQMETELVDNTGIIGESNVSESHAAVRMAKTLFMLCEQISNGADLLGLKEQAEAILNSIIPLKDFFEAKITAFDDELGESKAARARKENEVNIQNKLEDHYLREKTFSTSCPGPESLEMKDEFKVAYSGEGLLKEVCEIEKLKFDILLKEQEIGVLRDCPRESQTQTSSLQNEKKQLEEKMESMLREGTMISKYLNDLRNEIMMLNGRFDSQVSANKVLERKSSELEREKRVLEIHLLEVEKENIGLSERICGLEAQLRYLTDEKESSRLELENSESCAIKFREEIRRLESELETRKVDMKHKMQDMRKRWLAAQEESEFLKMANVKLQTTAESLIEDCSSLQKSNIEFRNQKGELHKHCIILEAELKESEKVFSGMFKKVEVLEGKHTTMLEEIASKEIALNLELDTLLEENKQTKEKLMMEESRLNQMYIEKSVEVEDLQRQVAHLTEQKSSSHDGMGETVPNAIFEVSRLRAEKAFLEASLQDVRGKLNLSENSLSTLQTESETKLQKLKNELAASKKNQEVLMADHEKLLELLEDVKSNEGKQKIVVRGLELKLKTSEYGRLQATEEIASLKLQLQKTALLQNDILALKRSLNEVKLENQRLEASFQIISADYEALNAEKVQSEKKISDMQGSVSQLEECKRSRVALEEKVLRLEGDLTAREALGVVDAELKNELARVKIANNEFQRKIRYLEEEKQEYQKRAQAFEEKPEEHKSSVSTSHESSLSQVITRPACSNGRLPATEIDPFLKIQLREIETELAEALEANGLYKAQLKSLLSGEQKDKSNIYRNLEDEDEVEKGDRDQHRTSLLEAELKDMREQYFHMSLKCAEVEAEREQLVLKLKPVNTGRRWFS